MNTQKYVNYLRVSTDKQEESGLGLDAQLRSIQEHTKNGIVIGSFTEIESRRNNNRPQIKLAIQLALKHNATLIIAKLDRLTGDSLFINQLLASDLKFKCLDNPDATPLMLRLLTAFSQEEVEKTSTRTTDALASIKEIIKKEGKHTSKKSGRTITSLGNPYLQNKEKAREHALYRVSLRSYTKKSKLAQTLVPILKQSGLGVNEIHSKLLELGENLSIRSIYNYAK